MHYIWASPLFFNLVPLTAPGWQLHRQLIMLHQVLLAPRLNNCRLMDCQWKQNAVETDCPTHRT